MVHNTCTLLSDLLTKTARKVQDNNKCEILLLRNATIKILTKQIFLNVNKVIKNTNSFFSNQLITINQDLNQTLSKVLIREDT